MYQSFIQILYNPSTVMNRYYKDIFEERQFDIKENSKIKKWIT